MNNDQFIQDLKDKFRNKGTWMKPSYALEDAVFDTIKAYMSKKNLVIISRSDLSKLENKAGNIPENY